MQLPSNIQCKTLAFLFGAKYSGKWDMHFPFQEKTQLFHHIFSHWKTSQIPNKVLRGFPRLHDDLHRLPCRHRYRGGGTWGTVGTAAAFGGRSAPEVFGAPNLTTLLG